MNNFDISLFKIFPISERARLQFRAEMYNAFNHTQFSAFDTAARSPRIMQMALRFSF